MAYTQRCAFVMRLTQCDFIILRMICSNSAQPASVGISLLSGAVSWSSSPAPAYSVRPSCDLPVALYSARPGY